MDHTTKNATSLAGLSGVENILLEGKNSLNCTTITPKNTVSSNALTAKDCTKFPECNAPQCPYDPRSLDAPYYSGEPICYWLLEYGKPKGLSKIKQCHRGVKLELVGRAYSSLLSTHGIVKKRLERASRTPSRLGVTA